MHTQLPDDADKYLPDPELKAKEPSAAVQAELRYRGPSPRADISPGPGGIISEDKKVETEI